MNTKLDDRVGIVHTMTTELSVIIKGHLDRATRSCINCSMFDEPSETCVRFKIKPPARIIAFGCINHEDQIPF
jgi:hypothetical protein